MAPHRNIRAFAALAMMLGAVACNRSAPTPGVARGKEVFRTCVPCHGSDGSGNAELQVPSIAGLPAWYIQTQLHNFQASRRGANPYDTVGLRMRSMSFAIDLKGDIQSVADYVSSLPRPDVARTLAQGDPKAGATVYLRCVACHGQDGGGNKAVNAPPLVGASDYYLLKQLEDFKRGWRGTDPKDVGGLTMRPNALPLDQTDMVNVVAYITTLKPTK